MIVNKSESLRYYSFESFPEEKVFHGIFTRQGGVSSETFTSLNVSGMAGDSRENVIENRTRILNVFNRRRSSSLAVLSILDLCIFKGSTILSYIFQRGSKLD